MDKTDGGVACPKCGVVSYSWVVRFEDGDADCFGVTPVWQYKAFAQCGHWDESQPKISIMARKRQILVLKQGA